MNPRWLLIRRLRGPAYLLTFGLTALLHQWGVLSFGQSWPLYLIVAGILTLLERSAVTALDPSAYPAGNFSTGQYPGSVPSSHGWGQPGQPVTPSTSIVPVPPADITPEGRL